ncbi:hypothetical protein EVAR_61184_1, partial [Eumeta japonica]
RHATTAPSAALGSYTTHEYLSGAVFLPPAQSGANVLSRHRGYGMSQLTPQLSLLTYPVSFVYSLNIYLVLMLSELARVALFVFVERKTVVSPPCEGPSNATSLLSWSRLTNIPSPSSSTSDVAMSLHHVTMSLHLANSTNYHVSYYGYFADLLAPNFIYRKKRNKESALICAAAANYPQSHINKQPPPAPVVRTRTRPAAGLRCDIFRSTLCLENHKPDVICTVILPGDVPADIHKGGGGGGRRPQPAARDKRRAGVTRVIGAEQLVGLALRS